MILHFVQVAYLKADYVCLSGIVSTSGQGLYSVPFVACQVQGSYSQLELVCANGIEINTCIFLLIVNTFFPKNQLLEIWGVHHKQGNMVIAFLHL